MRQGDVQFCDGCADRVVLDGCGIGVVVDVETTGLRPERDEILELCLLLFAYARGSGRVLRLLDDYTGLRQPSCPIPPGVAALHGITMAQVRGRALDHGRVRGLLARSEFIVAHHAAFDRSFVVRMYPEAAERPWLCSAYGIDWRRKGFASRRLHELVTAHGIPYESRHRAAADARALMTLLAHPLPGGTTYLYELLRRHRRLRR